MANPYMRHVTTVQNVYYTGSVDGLNAVFVAGGWDGAVGSPVTPGHLVGGVLCYWGGPPISSTPIGTVPQAGGVDVWVNGVQQLYGVDYTVGGAVSMGATGLAAGQLAVGWPVTLATPPHSGDTLRFDYHGELGASPGGWS